MGLPGSGKTTLATALSKELKATHYNADAVRATISKDLSFSIVDRIEQASRMSKLCDAAISKYVVADFVCPTRETRSAFNADFTIWVNRIDKGRFEDTNKLFEIPDADVIIPSGMSVEEEVSLVLKMLSGKVVFTNGCFDILHRGHIEYLRASKESGDYLIVGLNSDASIKRLKGSDRPINSQENRRELLLELRCVDEVIIFDEDTPYNLIARLKPDVLTKGGDYTLDQIIGKDLVNQTIIIPHVNDYSTTKTLEKVNEVERNSTQGMGV